MGGFSYTVSDDLRLYLIETAQKGMAWKRLTARGRAGHGSMINDDKCRHGAVRGRRPGGARETQGPADQDREGGPVDTG